MTFKQDLKCGISFLKPYKLKLSSVPPSNAWLVVGRGGGG